jgi:hypothetical protein
VKGAKKPERLPTLMTKEEICRVLAVMPGIRLINKRLKIIEAFSRSVKVLL